MQTLCFSYFSISHAVLEAISRARAILFELCPATNLFQLSVGIVESFEGVSLVSRGLKLVWDIDIAILE